MDVLISCFETNGLKWSDLVKSGFKKNIFIFLHTIIRSGFEWNFKNYFKNIAFM